MDYLTVFIAGIISTITILLIGMKLFPVPIDYSGEELCEEINSYYGHIEYHREDNKVLVYCR